MKLVQIALIMIWVIGIILGLFSINTVYAFNENELDEKLNEIAEQHGITDKEKLEQLKEQIKKQVESILATKKKLSYSLIQIPCKADIERLCLDANSVSEIIQCLKDNRNSVTPECEKVLRNEFGSKPLKEAQLYNGVIIPAGSTFFYDRSGNILGIDASEDVKYKDILFQKGPIWLHEGGIGVGRLVKDQYIGGIKYASDGIGPFFYENGTVKNATLAEDTVINGVIYQKDGQIVFHPDGKVSMGTIGAETKISGILLKTGTRLSINREGILGFLISVKDTKVNGILYEKNKTINFYPNGNVKIGFLAEDVTIKGKQFKAGTRLYYKEDGSVREIRE